jgi:hypothetical protein
MHGRVRQWTDCCYKRVHVGLRHLSTNLTHFCRHNNRSAPSRSYRCRAGWKRESLGPPEAVAIGFSVNFIPDSRLVVAVLRTERPLLSASRGRMVPRRSAGRKREPLGALATTIECSVSFTLELDSRLVLAGADPTINSPPRSASRGRMVPRRGAGPNAAAIGFSVSFTPDLPLVIAEAVLQVDRLLPCPIRVMSLPAVHLLLQRCLTRCVA